MRTFVLAVAAFVALATFVPAPASAQSDIRDGYFQTSDGVRLHYLEAGVGPLLVFVPGWTMPAWIWQHQLEYFAASYRVVALDPRGHGESEKATYGYTALRGSQDICELLAHLNSGPATIVGWSIAGPQVLLCAETSTGDVVRSVVVVDWDIKLEANKDFAADRIASVQGNREAFTRSFVEAIHTDPAPEYVEALTEAVLTVPTNAAAISTANWYFFGPHDMGPVLDRLDRPVLLVYSALDWAVEAAAEARVGRPTTRIEVIAETSHALFVDRPDAFNRLLADFMTSLRN